MYTTSFKRRLRAVVFILIYETDLLNSRKRYPVLETLRITLFAAVNAFFAAVNEINTAISAFNMLLVCITF